MFIAYFCAVFLISYVRATFWLGIEQCSDRRRNLVSDESDPRFTWRRYQKPAPEKWSRFMKPVSGVCATRPITIANLILLLLLLLLLLLIII